MKTHALRIMAGCLLASISLAETRISLMAFNVENLFDTEHDAGKDDIAYLPIAQKQASSHQKACKKQRVPMYREECLRLDWSPQVLAKKIQKLVGVISSVNHGKGADIIVLEEVENLRVLKMLQKALGAHGSAYPQAILIEGPDDRGVDVAMLSRLKLDPHSAPRLHEVDFSQSRHNKKPRARKTRSRGILEARFLLDKKNVLTVWGVHFPSAAKPTWQREEELDQLSALQAKLAPGALALAAGDFNINHREDQRKKIWQLHTQETWFGLNTLSLNEEGSHYYAHDRSWSFLDNMLFSKNLVEAKKGQWKIDVKSARVVSAGPDHKSFSGTPLRFEAVSGRGVSDHWPLYVELLRAP